MDLTIPALLAASLLLLGVAALLAQNLAQRRKLRRRFAMARGEAVASPALSGSSDLKGVALSALASLGRATVNSGLLPARTIAELQQSAAGSGLRGAYGLWLFVGSKIALLTGAPLVVFLAGGGITGSKQLAEMGIAAALGLVAPDMILRRLREARQARLDRGVPDALDLLVICAQAGIGLESAIWRVSEEIRQAHKEIAEELETTAADLQMSGDTRAALTALGNRTGVASLRRVTSVLAQTLQYGTPLTEALRALAAEMRQEALTKFEERAARLPVLLTVPMVVFILPCFFLIVGGPAVIRIGQAFAH